MLFQITSHIYKKPLSLDFLRRIIRFEEGYDDLGFRDLIRCAVGISVRVSVGRDECMFSVEEERKGVGFLGERKRSFEGM